MEHFDKLRIAASAYQESCVLGAAAELDLFTKIIEQKNSATADDLARSLDADPRGTETLLDALAATGYLVKSNGYYSVADSYVELLDGRSPKTYIPMIRHMVYCQRHWLNLALTIKTGKPVECQPGFLSREDENTAFILAMNSIGRTLVDSTIADLNDAKVLSFKKRPIRFIDIGGASGTYTMAFFKAIPDSLGVIFDLPIGIREAKKRFAGTEFEPRLTLVEGDFYKDEFPGENDFAWISAIIHQHDRKASRELYEKAFRALNPGGTVAIRDFVMDSDRTRPLGGAFFGINMLVNTQNGMVYTENEIREDLESVGFENVRLAVPAETMSAVMTATKPVA